MARKNNVITYEHDAWIAVYVLGKKEHFEIRTKSEAFPGYRILCHSEKPLGTTLADLLYLNTSNLASLLNALFKSLESIQPSMSAKDLNKAIETTIEAEHYLWHFNPFFATFILITEDLLSEAKTGSSVSLSNLYNEYERYLALLPLIENIAEKCFDPDNYEAPKARSASRLYFDLQKTDSRLYPILRFAAMKHEVVQSGCDQAWPYNEHRTGKYMNHFIKNDDYYETNTDVLETRDLADIFHFLIGRCLQEEIRMRKCKYCGRYFSVTDNYGAEYCNRLIDGSTKTCREIGSVRLYEQRIMVDPIMQAYKRSYKTHNARIRYGYSTKEEFAAWSKEARAMRDKCLAGEISLDEFTEWLDSDKMR